MQSNIILSIFILTYNHSFNSYSNIIIMCSMQWNTVHVYGIDAALRALTSSVIRKNSCSASSSVCGDDSE